MKNLWVFFLVGLSAASISKKLFVSSEPLPQVTDDLYIEGLPSGDSPVDDEGDDDNDDGSGSGSGDYPLFEDYEEILRRLRISSGTIQPTETLPTPEPPYPSTTAAAGGQGPEHSAEVTKSSFSDNNNMIPGDDLISYWNLNATTTDSPTSAFTESNWGSEYVEEDVTKKVDNRVFLEGGQRDRVHEFNSAEGVTSENLWDRTDVLAAVIACGVVGFLCAVSLLLLLAYRMKKKDEGSYELGDTKLSATAYHKAPTKEFYA